MRRTGGSSGRGCGPVLVVLMEPTSNSMPSSPVEVFGGPGVHAPGHEQHRAFEQEGNVMNTQAQGQESFNHVPKSRD